MEDIAATFPWAYFAVVAGFIILGSVAGGWLPLGWGFLGIGLILHGAATRLYDILWHIWNRTKV
jgi:hypothetical protein